LLVARAELFAGGTFMNQDLPNIDFSLIPLDLKGLWVVLKLDDHQEIVGQGESPQEALLQSRIDPRDPRFALTQVPEIPTAARMAHSARPNS
jgi:hypothetical protein